MPEAVLVFNYKFMTRFMQDADMFEKFKVFIKPPVYADVIEGWGEKNIERIRQITDEEGKYSLVAAVGPDIVWTDPNVKVVSLGDKWAMLDDYVEYLKTKVSPWRLNLGGTDAIADADSYQI